MVLQYETVPAGWRATPGSGAVAARNSGAGGGSRDPVLDRLSFESVLLTDDVHDERREGGRGAPDVLCRCWHLKHRNGC